MWWAIQTQTLYPTSVVNDTTFPGLTWSSPASADISDGAYADAGSKSFSGSDSQYLKATGYGFSIPTGATILGIQVNMVGSNSGPNPVNAFDASIRLVKNNSVQGTDKATGGNTWETQNWGGSSDLWGLSWTPNDINASDFGAALAAHPYGDGTSRGYARTDAIGITVYYAETAPIGFYANPSVTDGSALSSATGDPTNGARGTTYMTYEEQGSFLIDAVTQGSDGLWDFSLTSSADAAGKSYCLRVVNDDGSPLDTYSQIPEISFTNPTPTLKQVTRGGRAVVDGIESPFSW